MAQCSLPRNGYTHSCNNKSRRFYLNSEADENLTEKGVSKFEMIKPSALC